MTQDQALARLSPCVKAKVGAVIYTPSGDLVGEGLGVKSGTRLELCFSVHAEQWAIHQAGPLAKGATLYVASFDDKWNKRLKDSSLPLGHPMHGFYCSMCARACWMAGIARIITDATEGRIVEYTPEEIWETSYGVAGSI
jgi:tRNA(Arg) A34 adenosine deaminase TadA